MEPRAPKEDRFVVIFFPLTAKCVWLSVETTLSMVTGREFSS